MFAYNKKHWVQKTAPSWSELYGHTQTIYTYLSPQFSVCCEPMHSWCESFFSNLENPRAAALPSPSSKANFRLFSGCSTTLIIKGYHSHLTKDINVLIRVLSFFVSGMKFLSGVPWSCFPISNVVCASRLWVAWWFFWSLDFLLWQSISKHLAKLLANSGHLIQSSFKNIF